MSIPELPNPTTARSKIDEGDEAAAAQTAKPISKMRKKAIRIYYTSIH